MSCCVSTCCNDVKNLKIVGVDAARQSVYFSSLFRWGMPVPVAGFHVQPRKVLNVAFEKHGRVFLWLVQAFFYVCAFARKRPCQEREEAFWSVKLRLTIHTEPFCLSIVCGARQAVVRSTCPRFGKLIAMCEDWAGNGFTASSFYAFYGRACYHF